MKENFSTRISKKIRNKLIYYTYIELKNKQRNKHYLLINSLSPNDLNNKYQKCSDYCVEKTETYISSEINYRIDNNNYFHACVTYTSANDNYHMLVDNNNVEQSIGKLNIVGKYYKGNTIQIRTTTDNSKYKIKFNENKLEKQVIGGKKFIRKRGSLFHSLGLIKNINIIDNENNNEMNENLQFNNLNSNNNDENFKKIIKQNNNIEKIQTNCALKMRKTNTLKMQNKYIAKLKKYCYSLIIINKKSSLKNLGKNSNNKITDPPSPIIDKKRKKIDKNNFRNEKERAKIDNPHLMLNSNEIMSNRKKLFQFNLNTRNPTETKNNPSIHKKLKSQTKIHQNLFIFKIQSKRSFKKHKSIDKFEKNSPKKRSLKKLFSPKKHISPKKIGSPKKLGSPKKIGSPKKASVSPKKASVSPKKASVSPKKVVNSSRKGGGGSPKKKGSEYNWGTVSKLYIIDQKFNKKEKSNGTTVRKFISGNKLDFPLYKKKVNLINNNGDSKSNNNNEKIFNSNIFKANNNHITKRGRFKKSLTINKKMYKFKGADLIEKKLNTNKNKEGNKH